MFPDMEIPGKIVHMKFRKFFLNIGALLHTLPSSAIPRVRHMKLPFSSSNKQSQ